MGVRRGGSLPMAYEDNLSDAALLKILKHAGDKRKYYDHEAIMHFSGMPTTRRDLINVEYDYYWDENPL